MKVVRLVGVLLVLFVAESCGSPSAPSLSTASPPPAASPAADLTGAWTGSARDSQGATLVTWQIAQAGRAISGTIRTTAMNPDDGSCGSCHRNKSGTVSGTLDGAALTLTMFFAAGADGDPTPACSATLTASSASASSAAVAASYSGSDTCEGVFADGTMTMTRR